MEPTAAPSGDGPTGDSAIGGGSPPGWRRAAGAVRALLLGPPARTRRQRALRGGFYLLLASYLLLCAEPAVLFAHEVRHARFVVRSDAPLPPRTRAILDDAARRLAGAPFDDPTLVHRAYLCGAPWRMRLLAPFSTDAFAINHSVGSIIVNRCDVAADRVHVGEHARSLSGVLTHEATHGLLRRRLGLVGAMRLPPWKNEGLCDFVAGESSLDDATGWRLLQEGAGADSGGFFYWRARLMVEQLLVVEGVAIDDLFAQEHDEAAVLERVRARGAAR